MKPFFLALALAVTPLLIAKPGDSIYLGDDANRRLVINNRIVANVHGKPISVMDVMKKMDMIFYQQFPQYVESLEARYQFYKMHWKKTLEDLIDKELIMADATENKMPVSNGDVRQEMENLFGPNIIGNLDKIDLSYDKAVEMVRGDILLRRMLYYRVNVKALRNVTPDAIRTAYNDFVKDRIRPSTWTYRVVTIRADDPAIGAGAANQAYRLLAEEATPIEELQSALFLSDNARLSLSDEFTHSDQEVNPDYLTVLKEIGSAGFSAPVKQVSRSDKSTVFRIFCVKGHNAGGAVPLREVEREIKEALTRQEMEKETVAYLTKLRQHYGISANHIEDMVSADFEPFLLQ